MLVPLGKGDGLSIVENAENTGAGVQLRHI
jgi:hypothetical protein